MLNHKGKRCRKSLFTSHVWVEDLVYFDGPLVSYFKGSTIQDFIYIFVDCGRYNRWLTIPVERESIIKYRDAENSLLDLVEQAEHLYLLDIDGEANLKYCWVIDREELSDEYLPATDSFFDVSLCPNGDQALLEPTIYSLNLNGNWFLEDWSRAPKLFIQIYSLVYALKYLGKTSVNDSARRLFSQFPWKGNFSPMHFYNGLNSVIPSLHEPKIASINYNSPGTIELELLSDVSEIASEIVNNMGKKREKVALKTSEIKKFLKEKNYSTMREYEELPSLPREHKRVLRKHSEELLSLLAMKRYSEDIFDLSSNELIATKICLSICSRLEKIDAYRSSGLLEI